MSATEILIVEDDNDKFMDIRNVVLVTINAADIVRAETVVDAERYLSLRLPSLLVLDISMNISSGSMGPMRGGFANLGGLDLIDRLYYLGDSCPTIIVTGFDLFKSAGPRQPDYEMIGLDGIEELASQRMGQDLIACIRYQSPGWVSAFADALRSWSGE